MGGNVDNNVVNGDVSNEGNNNSNNNNNNNNNISSVKDKNLTNKTRMSIDINALR